KKFDFIVVQEQTTNPLVNQASFVKYATLFVNEIKKTDAKPILFLNWQRHDAPAPATQDTLNQTYYTLAGHLQVKVSPIGQAWRIANRNLPQINLYNVDSVHPTPYGSYLEACVLFATFYGKTPVGLPATLRDANGNVLINLPTDVARALQRVAWETYNSSR